VTSGFLLGGPKKSDRRCSCCCIDDNDNDVDVDDDVVELLFRKVGMTLSFPLLPATDGNILRFPVNRNADRKEHDDAARIMIVIQ
jgi:hypothetical protein